MQQIENNSSTPDKHAGPNSVLGIQEAYKSALVEVIKEVMHPPNFTDKDSDNISQRTSRYAWCVNINRLLRNFKSVTSRLAPADIPGSFEDIDAFVRDAWQFSFTDEVPNFYIKWPGDLDKRVEGNFEIGGEPLGKMMTELPLVHSESESGSTGQGLGEDGRGQEPDSAASSAVLRCVSGRAAGCGGTSALTSPTSCSVTFSSTPQTTPTLDPHTYNTSSQSSLGTSHALTPSPSRRFSMADFERLLRDRNKDGQAPKVSEMKGREKPAPRRRNFTTASQSLTVQRLRQSLDPKFSSPDTCPPPPSETPASEFATNREDRGSTSVQRSASERPSVPQSYRDGSLSVELTELHTEIDDVYQVADTLIDEAATIDARDGSENRLREWTSRAKECEVRGRNVFKRISSDLAEEAEVRWLTSTLKLLKSAHAELIEYADSILNPSSTTAATSDPTSGSGDPHLRQVRREATTILQPPIRRSTVSTSPSETRETPAEASRGPWIIREVDRHSELPGPSRPSARRRSLPYVLIPPAPWKWRPAPRQPASEPESDGEPKTRILTTSITIRTRQVNSADNVGSAPSSSSSSSSRNYHTTKLQRMTDRRPGDKERNPPCSECAVRGFSCFGKREQLGACRRCQRVRKGHCTYARLRVRVTGEPTSATRAKAKGGRIAKGKGDAKGKGKEVVKPRAMQQRLAAGTGIVKGKYIEGGLKRSRRSSVALKKLKSARERMEQQREANGDSDDQSGDGSESENDGANEDDSGSEAESNHDAPPLKRRRREESAHATYEPDMYMELYSEGIASPHPAGAAAGVTSEPSDRLDASMGRSQSKEPRPRPRFASLARARTSATDSDVIFDPLRGRTRSGDADVDTQSTMRSIEPEHGHAYPAMVERDFQGEQDQDVQMQSQHAPAHEMDTGMEMEQGGIQPIQREVEHSDIEHNSIASLSGLTTDALMASPAPPPAALAASVISLPNPASLTGSSPTGNYTIPHLQTGQEQQQHRESNEPHITALRAKLDALMAAQAALSSQVVLQAGAIEEVREELRLLEAGGSASH